MKGKMKRDAMPSARKDDAPMVRRSGARRKKDGEAFFDRKEVTKR